MYTCPCLRAGHTKIIVGLRSMSGGLSSSRISRSRSQGGDTLFPKGCKRTNLTLFGKIDNWPFPNLRQRCSSKTAAKQNRCQRRAAGITQCQNTHRHCASLVSRSQGQTMKYCLQSRCFPGLYAYVIDLETPEREGRNLHHRFEGREVCT